MAGIYIHIPFCKRACYYCDFHFSTAFSLKDKLVASLLQEISLQQDYLSGNTVDTIYFGGGTPSILSAKEIDLILSAVAKHHTLGDQPEVTLEANPDDLQHHKLLELKSTAINRLSIGVQSFYEEDLTWMNRAHSAAEAHQALVDALETGFEDITIDLIYGYPQLSMEKWESNINKAIALGIPHLSAYSMTVEPKTALDSFINKGKYPPMDEDQSAQQFVFLMDKLMDKGYEHYEISNFALDGRYARHNSNYWKGVHYLGIGPSAHSYNGLQRSWNVAHNRKYIDQIALGTIPSNQEKLSREDQLNEYIMVSLRTMWGLSIKHIENRFGEPTAADVRQELLPFVKSGHITLGSDDVATLSKAGKLIADHIISELFIPSEEED